MKRLLSLILALIFCAFPLVSCSEEGESDVPAGMARAKSAALDLWLFYPESWSITENEQTLRLVSAEQSSLEGQMSAADVTDGAAVLPSNIGNVSVCRLKDGVEDLKAFAEGEWRENFSEKFVFDEKVDERKLGQDPTYTAFYHLAASKEDKILYRFSQTLILHKGTVFALTFTATPELYDILEEAVGEIRSSVTFTEIAEADNTPLRTTADPVVKEDAEKFVQKEGLTALTNKGVEFVLYYPSEGWTVVTDSGYLAIANEDGASVSVVKGDAYAAQIQTPTDYLEKYYYPTFDALYGTHKELSRREVTDRADAWLLEATYSATVGGEDYTFLQALYFRNGYIYTLLYTAKTELFDAHLAEAETMVREFTLK